MGKHWGSIGEVLGKYWGSIGEEYKMISGEWEIKLRTESPMQQPVFDESTKPEIQQSFLQGELCCISGN
ncbi:hypothetical protein ABLB84_12155 [Xenorhabdus szentirmaii]|uniref:hypothetical protein n=1 Tax=Xenorhabdus szentirmaii TaxID=290112 RepID=UPI0032B80675